MSVDVDFADFVLTLSDTGLDGNSIGSLVLEHAAPGAQVGNVLAALCHGASAVAAGDLQALPRALQAAEDALALAPKFQAVLERDGWQPIDYIVFRHVVSTLEVLPRVLGKAGPSGKLASEVRLVHTALVEAAERAQ